MFLLRAAITAVALVAWFWTQSLISQRGFPAGAAIGDGLHDLSAPLNQNLHHHPAIADGLLIVSSGFIDAIGIFLLGSWLLGRSIRPFLALVMVVALRQVFQWLVALPAPPDMIWRYPGFPSLLVTYHVANDYFFSGHSAVAVLGAWELARTRRSGLVVVGVALALFEMATVIVLRAHYTMDVFAGVLAALACAHLAERLSPRLDSRLGLGAPAAV
jgi:hypothetical protein